RSQNVRHIDRRHAHCAGTRTHRQHGPAACAATAGRVAGADDGSHACDAVAIPRVTVTNVFDSTSRTIVAPATRISLTPEGRSVIAGKWSISRRSREWGRV